MAFLPALAAGVTGLSESAGAQALPLNSRNAINVAPVGVNLGAIMQPYTENPFHGGFGFPTQPPTFSGTQATANLPFSADSVQVSKAKIIAGDSNNAIPLAIGGVLILVAVAAAASRRG